MHSLDQKYIELLADKKLKGTITSEEQTLLNQWLNREPPEQMNWFSEDVDEAMLRERLLKRIKEDVNISDTFSVRKRLFRKRYQWAAAVILLLMTGGLGYFMPSQNELTSVKLANNEHKTGQDIAPGHNGAILTLANGNQITLDSAGNGRIAIQGNRQLMKMNGQLVYEKMSEKDKVSSKNDVSYNTITTPRGRVFNIVLSDGSKVWLNAASSITYPTAFTGKKRKVSIKGEAYFEIAEDYRHPFIVSVGEATITVLGTHFDVMAYPNEKMVKTTLLEGAVKVSHRDQQVVMEPEQQASFSAKSDCIKVEKVNTNGLVAWIEGSLSMNNLDVSAIMRKISRWYDVDVEFVGPVPEDHYWGIINRNVNLSDMLKVMRANGIDAQLKNNKIIVTSTH